MGLNLTMLITIIGEENSPVRNRKNARNNPIDKIGTLSRIPKVVGLLPSWSLSEVGIIMGAIGIIWFSQLLLIHFCDDDFNCSLYSSITIF